MMARVTEPDSDEDIWEYSTQREKKTKSSAKPQVSGSKRKKTPIIAQSQPLPVSVKGKGKGKGKSSARPLSTQLGKSNLLRDRKSSTLKQNNGEKTNTKSSAGKPANATPAHSQTHSQIGKKRKTPSFLDDSTEPRAEPLKKSPRLDVGCTPKSTGHNKQKSTIKKTQSRNTSTTKTPKSNTGSSIPEIQIESAKTPVPITSVPKKEGYCPFCQMPFRCLVVESPRWHTTECMDLPLKTTTECPAGVKCDSTLANHYRRFTHSVLANIRAGVTLSGTKPSPANKVALALTPSQKAHIRRLDFGTTPSSTAAAETASATTSPYFKTEAANGQTTTPTPHSKKQLDFTTKKEDEYCHCDSPGCTDPTGCTDLAPFKASPVSQADTDDDGIESDEDIFSGKPNQRTDAETYEPPKDQSSIPDLQNPSVKKNKPTVCSVVKGDEPRFETKDLSDMLSDALADDDGEDAKENVPQTIEVEEEEEDKNDILPLPDIAEVEVPAHSDGEEDDSVFTAVQEPIVIEPDDETVNTDICILSANPKPSTSNRNSLLSPAKPQSVSPKIGTKQTSISNFFFSKNPKPEKQMTNGALVSVPSSLSVPPPSDKKWPLLRSGSSKAGAAVQKPSTSRSNGAAGPSTSTGWGGRKQKQCPFYKKMPGTPFTVDAFCYGTIPGCKAYILTHFHYDHYGGLTRKFNHPIYCSKITGNLVQAKIKVDPRYINTIPLNTPRMVEGVELTFMEANHCPGSVIILFRLPNGQVYLHTGDFRACPEMELYPFLQSVHINQLYLDTTYCDPGYAFPPQKDVINFAVAKVAEVLSEAPNTLVAVGSYTVGKERIFMAIAEDLNCRICVSRDKKVVLECMENAGIKKRLTLEPRDAKVHVLPMRQLRYESLSKYVNGLKPRFDRVLAFEPTGWTHAGGTRRTGLENLRPKYNRDNITIYGVPYSEHSSYTEMKRFCQVMRPDRILATVNNGSAESRAKMDKLFDSWMKEKLESPNKLKQAGLKTWLK